MAAANSARSRSPDSDSPVSKRQQKREARLEQEYTRRLKASSGRNSRPSSANTEVLLGTPPAVNVPAAAESKSFAWRFHVLAVFIVILVSLMLKKGEDSYMSETQGSKLIDMNPYEVLEVPKNATAKELKKAHRRLSLDWHPDRREDCDNACHAKFRQINEAYRILANADQRVLYDKYQKVVTGSSKSFFTDMKAHEYLFSAANWHNIVKPSLKGKMVPDRGERYQTSRIWALLIAEPTREWTEHMLPMWSDLADRFHGRINFMRVDAKDPAATASLPVKLPLLPAIMVLSPHESPHVYEKMMHMTPLDLAEWLAEHIPNTLEQPRDARAYIETFNRNGTDQQGRPLILHISAKPPSQLIRSIADQTQPLFRWIHVEETPGILSQISNLTLPEKSSKTRGHVVASTRNGPAVISLSSSLWNNDKLDLRKRKVDADAPQTKARKLLTHLRHFLRSVRRGNAMPLFEENIGPLCTSRNEEESVVCAVYRQATWDPTQILEDADNANDITIQQVFISEQMPGLLESRLSSYASVKVPLYLDYDKLKYKYRPDMDWAPIRRSFRSMLRRLLGLPAQSIAPRLFQSWRERIAHAMLTHKLVAASTSLVLTAVCAIRLRSRSRKAES